MTFSEMNFVERRQVIEDALAFALTAVGDIMTNDEGERCIGVMTRIGGHEVEWNLTPLYQLACWVEGRLE